MNVELTTKIMLIAVICISVILLGLLVARRKQVKKIIKIILPVIMVILIVANAVIFSLQNVINQFFSVVKVDALEVEEATRASKDITTVIEEEGIVLLENKNNVLPLSTKKVNVFGMSSISLIYGGAGSGASDETDNVTLEQGLIQAGFEVNSQLTDFYKERKGSSKKTNIFNLQGGDYNIKELDVSEYSDDLIKSAKEFSDVALIVFSRSGGEGGDLPTDMEKYKNGDAGKHYLELQNCEIALLDMVKSQFGTVIVIINSSNAMELGFLEDDAIDAALWIGGPGSTGCIAVGEVLAGKVNPSGRLVDTYAYDVTSSPAYYNAGNFLYTYNGETTKVKYVKYAEGIYVGYRYYETRYVDNKTGKCDEAAYSAAVQYPFGYGLSYTGFEKTIKSHTVSDGTINVEVEVKNTGKTAGKEVVQLYVTAPYYEGGIEKAHVQLVAYGKTKELAAGKSETISLSFSVEDMAAYDYKTCGCYVLEAGDYEIKLMDNAHELIESFTYSVSDTVVYDENNKRTADEVAATNKFDFAAGNVEYVSRADWAGTLPTEVISTEEATEDIINATDEKNIASIYASGLTADSNESVVKSGLVLSDMIGIPYDDENWELLINQLSAGEMAKLMGYGGFSTIAIDSIGKVSTIEIDGPAGLNALTSSISGVQFPSEVVIASTFNKRLVEQMGATYANEAVANGVVGLYAPGVNIHRTPFSGRNFEYYSEDPFLNGSLGSAMVTGCNSKGVYCYPKHFALNDQETNRSGVCVWANEQAIRELYLKPFEMIVKSTDMNAIMSSYNRLGTVWAGGCKALLTDVLRNEWGFKGIVVTDYANAKFMNADQALLAGGSLMLSTTGSTPTDAVVNTVEGKAALRRSTKDILYTVVNSRAYTDQVEMGFPYWVVILIAADTIIAAVMFVLLFAVKKQKR